MTDRVSEITKAADLHAVVEKLQHRFYLIPMNFDPTNDLQSRCNKTIEEFFRTVTAENLGAIAPKVRHAWTELEPHYKARCSYLETTIDELEKRVPLEIGKYRRGELESLIRTVVRVRSCYADLKTLITDLMVLR